MPTVKQSKKFSLKTWLILGAALAIIGVVYVLATRASGSCYGGCVVLKINGKGSNQGSQVVQEGDLLNFEWEYKPARNNIDLGPLGTQDQPNAGVACLGLGSDSLWDGKALPLEGILVLPARIEGSYHGQHNYYIKCTGTGDSTTTPYPVDVITVQDIVTVYVR